VSDLNKKIYGTIEAWRNRPIEGAHPYVYLDGIVLKRSWAGEVRNVSPARCDRGERARLSADSRHLRGPLRRLETSYLPQGLLFIFKDWRSR